MSGAYDVIVVGGGHNGLTTAAYLAKAGRSVLVLERRYILGGACVSEEVYPGFTYSVRSYVVSLFRPHIMRELDLPTHGGEILLATRREVVEHADAPALAEKCLHQVPADEACPTGHECRTRAARH